MPQVLLAHIRYPQDLFNIQAEVFSTYHVTQPDVLYSKGNQWAIPTGTSLSAPTGQMEPYYVIMRLPGQLRDEFVQILPFVPNGRPNMIGWLAAQSDVPNYGHAVSFAFPNGATVYGPTQVEAAVNQDPTVSQQLTLWGQEGSQVIIGNLLVMPIEGSLLYVQPLYLQSSTTALPQLKRVIVFYRASTSAGVTLIGGQQIVAMQPTLAAALAQIFGSAPPAAASGTPGAPTTPTTPTTPTGPVSSRVKGLIAQANSQFQAAQTALQSGDFAGYGKQIKALSATLKAAAGRQVATAPSARAAAPAASSPSAHRTGSGPPPCAHRRRRSPGSPRAASGYSARVPTPMLFDRSMRRLSQPMDVVHLLDRSPLRDAQPRASRRRATRSSWRDRPHVRSSSSPSTTVTLPGCSPSSGGAPTTRRWRPTSPPRPSPRLSPRASAFATPARGGDGLAVHDRPAAAQSLRLAAARRVALAGAPRHGAASRSHPTRWSGPRSSSISRGCVTRWPRHSTPSRETLRDAVVLRVVDGMSYAEAARQRRLQRGSHAPAREPRPQAAGPRPCRAARRTRERTMPGGV